MPPYNLTQRPPASYWIERSLTTIANQEGAKEKGQLTPVSIGTFIKAIENMSNDNHDWVNHQGQHPAYIHKTEQRKAMREDVEKWIYDLVSGLLTAFAF